MINVTIILENEVSRWAKIWAAKNDTSVSKLLGQLLKERMLEEEGYYSAKQQFLSRTPIKLKSTGEHYPERGSLILSAAQKLDCQIILSEDMQNQQQVGNLQIINPFVSDISIIA